MYTNHICIYSVCVYIYIHICRCIYIYIYVYTHIFCLRPTVRCSASLCGTSGFGIRPRRVFVSSNNYHTPGEHDIIFIKIGSNNILLLDHTYHISRHIFQNHTLMEI